MDVPSRHASSSYSGSSSRIESSSALSKDRYSERSSSDYRSTTRTDDRDRNGGSSKPRYLVDTPTETRFSERPSAPSSSTWPSATPHQSFSLNTPEIWAPKPSQESIPGAWRGLDDNRYNRFASNDRKPAIPTSQYIDTSTLRTAQFSGSNSSIIPGAGRFTTNRYDAERF